jgi:hypothetical protein
MTVNISLLLLPLSNAVIIRLDITIRQGLTLRQGVTIRLGVTVRRDNSILYYRTIINIMIYCFFVTIIICCFFVTISDFFVTISGFYITSLNTGLDLYIYLYYLLFTTQIFHSFVFHRSAVIIRFWRDLLRPPFVKLVFLFLLFIYIPKEWFSMANNLAFLLFNP